MKKITFLSVSLLLCIGYLQAETVEVTTTDMTPETPGSLPYVIANAPDATETTINFNFEGNTLTTPDAAINISNKKLTFNGLNKKNNERVTLMGSTTLFGISSASEVTLNNLIVKNYPAIALKISGASTIKANNCLFENNFEPETKTANNGGVMRISSANAIIDRCVFNKNRGGGSYGGGALCAYGASSLTLTNSTFINNQAASGGAISVKGTGKDGKTAVPKAYIANCTFANNMADKRAGALYLLTECTAGAMEPTIVNCTFVGNMSGEEGGAIGIWSVVATTLKPTLINNLFAENYLKIWTAGEAKNDVWAFYLTGAVNANNEPLPQTVFPVCKNNYYDTDSEPFFSDSSNKVANLRGGNLFQTTEKHPQDEGDSYFDHMTSVLTGDMSVAMIKENGDAVGKGISSFEGVVIPTTDQLGNTRPATPAVGAVEFGETSYLSGAFETSMRIWSDQNQLMVQGVNGIQQLILYDTTGNRILETGISDQSPVSLQALPKGIYLVKIGSKSAKITLP